MGDVIRASLNAQTRGGNCSSSSMFAPLVMVFYSVLTFQLIVPSFSLMF